MQAAVAAGAGINLTSILTGCAIAGERSVRGSEAAAPEALRRWVEAEAARWRIPGLAAVVAKEGHPLATFLLGKASVPFDVSVAEHTRFHIASIAKHITAMAVMRLVEAGSVRLDAPLGEFLDGLPAGWGERPIRSLLTHTSGIPDYEDMIVWDRPYTRESFLEMASSRPLDFEPGEGWFYSNTAYVLLGWLIQAVSGRSHARFIEEELLQRAGLQDSRVDDADAVIENRAEPYEWRDQELRHAVRMNGRLSGWTDGGILMSARDIAPWDAAINGDKLVRSQTRTAIFTPVRLNTGRSIPYGFGWSVDANPGGRSFHWHAGSVPGFTSFYFRVPQEGLAVAVLTNIGGRSRPQRFIAMSLAEHFVPGCSPLGLEPIPDRSPELTAAAREILFRGPKPLDPEMFAPELAVLVHGRLGNGAVINLGGDAARLRDIVVVQEEETSSQRVRRYRLEYGDHREHVSFGYAPDGRIYFVRLL